MECRARFWSATQRSSLCRLDADEFAARVELDQSLGRRFALFLGAGCSVSSGIPAAAELVQRRWLPRLHLRRCAQAADAYEPPAPHELAKWAAEQLPDYDPQEPAAAYGALLALLFPSAAERAREATALCRSALPGRGYALLAQLVVQVAGRFDVILTTNFDELVGQALRVYAACAPLQVGEQRAAACLGPERTRPLLVQLAGDTPLAASELAPSAQRLAPVLAGRSVIAIGHGGRDGALDALLAGGAGEADRDFFWVHPDEPHGRLRQRLEQRGARWVAASFEQAFEALRAAFRLPEPRLRTPAQILLDGLGEAAALALQPGTPPEVRQRVLVDLLAHARRSALQGETAKRLLPLLRALAAGQAGIASAAPAEPAPAAEPQAAAPAEPTAVEPMSDRSEPQTPAPPLLAEQPLAECALVQIPLGALRRPRAAEPEPALSAA